MASVPIVTEDISILQRGHFKMESWAAVFCAAVAPQCGQCLLPRNIIPKHDGQATVASFDSQYWHCGESLEIAAPQFGQLRVCASISLISFCLLRFSPQTMPTRSRWRRSNHDARQQ